MADPAPGMAFQAERLALVREIARNLVGESLPPTGTSSTSHASLIAEAGAASTDNTLLADRLAARGGALPGTPNLLAGLKLPHLTFTQPDAYRQALAQFAKS